jgi:hypothetical protein
MVAGTFKKVMSQVTPDDGTASTLRAFGQEAQILISSEETGNSFCLIRFSSPAGDASPARMQQNEDETFIIESSCSSEIENLIRLQPDLR